MIISGGSRCNWRYFAKHLTNSRDNERVKLVEVRGLAGDNVLEAFREMDALASTTRCKNFFYHADINPDERLTPDQWEQAVDTLEEKLGLQGQSRFVVQHEKKGRIHQHVIWSRIDPDSMTAISDSLNYAKHETAARELEEAFGHEPVRNAVTREAEEKRPERRPKDWETLRGSQTGIDPHQMKTEVSALWRSSDSGAAFKAALEERGFILCKGDRRDFCIVDQAGEEHSLARRLEGVKAAQIRERLADLDRNALPTVAEARELAKSGEGDTDAHAQLRERERDREQERKLNAAAAPFIADIEARGEIMFTAVPMNGTTWRDRAAEFVDRVRSAARDLYERGAERVRSWVSREREREEPERQR